LRTISQKTKQSNQLSPFYEISVPFTTFNCLKQRVFFNRKENITTIEILLFHLRLADCNGETVSSKLVVFFL